VTVGGGSWLLGEIQLPLYLRGVEGDIGDHHKKNEKWELLEHQIWLIFLNMTGLWK
jgi:hypothetical protein